MSALATALNSRRFIQLLPWLAGLVLAAGIIVFLLVFVRNTGDESLKSGGKSANAQPVEQRTVPLDPKLKQLANTFMKTAVARSNPVLAYQISGPEIRQGMTLAQWRRDWNDPAVGIPVVPYPIDKVQASPFRIDYSHENDALLEVALLPKEGSKIKPQIFFIGFKKYGKGTSRRWLVTYWGPHNTIALPSQ